MRRKPWKALAVGMVVVVAITGLVWAGPNSTPSEQDITRRVTIPGGFFIPYEDGLDWHNDGRYIRMDSGSGWFTAPVVFPCLPSVTVESLTLYAKDTNAADDARIKLFRTRPDNGIEQEMAYIFTGGTTVDVGEFVDSGINFPVVWPSQGVYLWLDIEGPAIIVYGVKIEYHRNI